MHYRAEMRSFGFFLSILVRRVLREGEKRSKDEGKSGYWLRILLMVWLWYSD